jgi:predicted transcriptional regulator
MTKRKPGRPPKAAEWHILTLRLEPEIIEKLDGLVERMYQKQDLNVTRVDLIRQAIRQYVERETAEVS